MSKISKWLTEIDYMNLTNEELSKKLIALIEGLRLEKCQCCIKYNKNKDCNESNCFVLDGYNEAAAELNKKIDELIKETK